MLRNKMNYYTQRQWDRVVGYGVVPDEYKIPKEEYREITNRVFKGNIAFKGIQTHK